MSIGERTDKVLFAAHGRAGSECYDLLVTDLGLPPGDVLCATYDLEASRELIQKARKAGSRVTFESLRDVGALSRLGGFKPDVIVSMHYRDRIAKGVLDSAPFGGFNLHPSLLPRYRGCLSGAWAIINQEARTGITYHYMNENFDDGRIVLQEELEIHPEDTGHSLFNRLVDLGVSNFAKAFRLVAKERFAGKAQSGASSYYGRRVPFDGYIDPQWAAAKIDAFIRAMHFPGFRGALVRTTRGDVEVSSMSGFEELKSSGVIVT